MSMLRNVLTYMGLGPDEDYDDGYLYKASPDRARGIDQSDLAADADDGPDRPTPAGGDEHALRERPEWLSRSGKPRGPSRRRIAIDEGDEGDEVAAGDQDNAHRPRGRHDPESAADRRGRHDYDTPRVTGGAIARSHHDAEPAPSPFGRPEPAPPSDDVRPLRAVPSAEADDSGITVRAVAPPPAEPEEPTTTYAKPHALSPKSFGDAATLADEFKNSVPVVMNLRGVERDLARRLIDFASGICYALDGGMEKLAPQVFLLTPTSVEVSEEERRLLEERGFVG
ncbi:MAG: cell division protein SepF [Acidimicrobiales bacterium]